MKKNLMILMLFVSVLMVSLVSAGITGYVLRINEKVGSMEVMNIDTTQNFVKFSDGQTAKVGETVVDKVSGDAYKVERVTKPFLGRARVEIVSVPKPVPEPKCSCYVYVGANPEGVSAEMGQQIYILNGYGQFVQSYILGGTMPEELDVSNGLWAQSMSCERLEESGETIYSTGTALEILQNIERPVPFYTKSCPGDVEVPTPTTGQCPGISTNSCRWVFKDETVSGGSKWNSAVCDSNEIVFEGSCGSPDNIWVDVKQSFAGGSSAWTCAFDTDPTFPNATLETGALCCKA